MEKTCINYSNAIIFFFIVFFTVFLSSIEHALVVSLDSSSELIRQPPRPLVITTHDRNDSYPQQVHISLAGKDHMRVSWVSCEKHVPSIVEYGKITGKYEYTSTGEHTSYRYFFYTSGDIHHVTIGPLTPGTTYYYRCGGSAPEFSFRTPPSTFPIEFAVAGDLGQTEWTASTLNHINATDYDVFLLPGDLSYADTNQPLWDSFGRLVEPYASRRPWMVTEGNHEIEIFPIIYPEGFKSYNARWQMPYKESGSESNLYYSFDVVGTHIIMLGSYTDFDASSKQYKWLEADLAKIDRLKTPWIFVLIHAPWYNTNSAHRGEGESMRKEMEEILYNARVDVVFAGHVHAYERFSRVFDNKVDECGPMHITIGDGGNREGLAMLFDKPSPEMSVFREASFGHGRLRVVNETHAHWSWHRNNDENALMADQIWLQSLSSKSQNCKVCSNQKFQQSSSRNDELK